MAYRWEFDIGKKTTMSDTQKSFMKIRNECGIENTHYSVVHEGLPEEFRLVAERDLNETEENKKRGLQKLRDYMKREHMTTLEDNYLLAVLRNCKYNLKKSEAKLKIFLAKRREIIKMLSELESEKIKNILDDFGFGILPYRDKHGRGVLYTRPYGMLVDRYDVSDVGLITATAALFLLKYPMSSVAGITFFGECKAPSLHIFYPIFKAFKHTMFYFFSFPMRISRVEIFNENSLCRCFYKVITPFLSKKLQSRICLHGQGYDSLHKLYDPKTLPEEFGGKAGCLSNAAYKQKLLNFIEDLKNENMYMTE